MRKTFLCICLTLTIILANTLTAAACWEAPTPFEIISDDGGKIFVFTPADDGMADAQAAVYEIIGNERQLIYSVEELSSFAYESSFYFSADMMHFARVFPEYGMSVFEVFSYGDRTRVVLRSDFIEDYDSIENFSSIGPFYTVTWSIEEHSPQDAAITIITDEGNTVIFDLETAKFTSESITPVSYEFPSEAIQEPIPQTQNLPIGIYFMVGAAIVFIIVGVFAIKSVKERD